MVAKIRLVHRGPSPREWVEWVRSYNWAKNHFNILKRMNEWQRHRVEWTCLQSSSSQRQVNNKYTSCFVAILECTTYQNIPIKWLIRLQTGIIFRTALEWLVKQRVNLGSLRFKHITFKGLKMYKVQSNSMQSPSKPSQFFLASSLSEAIRFAQRYVSNAPQIRTH